VRTEFDETRKEELIDILTSELRVLRAKMDISQQDLASRMGVSRQTLGLIEKRKHRMTWNHFMALLLIFRSNEGSASILDMVGAYPPELDRYIRCSEAE